jgi:type I site-specific restriction endonuclease
MTFLEENERGLLERLGIHVVDEQVIKEALDEIHYTIPISFAAEEARSRFLDITEQATLQILRAEPVRSSSGDPEPLKLNAVFDNQDDATAFIKNTELHAQLGIDRVSRKPIKHNITTVNRLLVQFSNQETLESFLREWQAYSELDATTFDLTNKLRRALFDALDGLESPSRTDRMGPKLEQWLQAQYDQQQHVYVDVDLWHPGSPSLVEEAIRQFRAGVAKYEGRVTDGPTGVAVLSFLLVFMQIEILSNGCLNTIVLRL